MASPSCPVCGESDPSRIQEIVVEGREIYLCQNHAGVVIRAKPATFEQLQGLFREERPERRSPISRRNQDSTDRRVFPRPEGRRLGYGRRASDPRE